MAAAEVQRQAAELGAARRESRDRGRVLRRLAAILIEGDGGVEEDVDDEDDEVNYDEDEEDGERGGGGGGGGTPGGATPGGRRERRRRRVVFGSAAGTPPATGASAVSSASRQRNHHRQRQRDRPLAPIADVPGVRLALGALGRRWTSDGGGGGGGGGSGGDGFVDHDGVNHANSSGGGGMMSPAAAAAAAQVDGDALCDAVAVLAAEARDRGARLEASTDHAGSLRRRLQEAESELGALRLAAAEAANDDADKSVELARTSATCIHLFSLSRTHMYRYTHTHTHKRVHTQHAHHTLSQSSSVNFFIRDLSPPHHHTTTPPHRCKRNLCL